ncbi:MAG: shikimate kinase [Promethearchaeia archaeon]
MKTANSITLIGMPGSGKTTIGQKIAQKLQYKFIDTDDYIVEKENMELQQIINKEGIDAFCEIEEKRVLELLPLKKYVIAPGGSIIYSKKVMDILKKNSILIFLDVPLNILKARLHNMETRGIVGLHSKSLKTLYKERIPLYRKYADCVVPCENKSPNTIITEILARLDRIRSK